MVLKIKANAIYIRTLMEESHDLSVCQGTVRRIKERKKGKPMASILSVLLPSYTSFYQTKVGGIINLAFLMSSTDRAGMVFFYVDFFFLFKIALDLHLLLLFFFFEIDTVSFIQWPQNGEAGTKFTDQLLAHVSRGI